MAANKKELTKRKEKLIIRVVNAQTPWEADGYEDELREVEYRISRIREG